MMAQPAVVFRPVAPAVSIRNDMASSLVGLVDKMHRSVLWWVRAAYRRRESEIVGDASPAVELEEVLTKTMRRWDDEFDELADTVAERFVRETNSLVVVALLAALRDAGFRRIPIRNTRRTNSIIQSIIKEIVALIKSIPRQYHTQVEGIIQRSLQRGRDLDYVASELVKRFNVTRHRAEFIARDQTNKATQAITAARWQDLGVDEGIWVHNAGGSKSYRETHVAFSGKRFSLSQGLYDSAVGYYVMPGELPNCKCTFRGVVPERLLA